MTAADVAALEQTLSAPDGWLPAALRRLAQDPVAGRLPEDDRPALARAARAAGAAMAGRWQRREPAEQTLSELGVEIVEDEGEARWGPLVHHARYTAPPARVTLYRRPLATLERVLVHLDVREVILAHELFHHLVQVGGAPAAVRPRVTTLRLGRWHRETVVRAAEEIAAAGFAGAWYGVDEAPELLDAVTVRIADGSDTHAAALRGDLAAG